MPSNPQEHAALVALRAFIVDTGSDHHAHEDVRGVCRECHRVSAARAGALDILDQLAAGPSQARCACRCHAPGVVYADCECCAPPLDVARSVEPETCEAWVKATARRIDDAVSDNDLWGIGTIERILRESRPSPEPPAPQAQGQPTREQLTKTLELLEKAAANLAEQHAIRIREGQRTSPFFADHFGYAVAALRELQCFRAAAEDRTPPAQEPTQEQIGPCTCGDYFANEPCERHAAMARPARFAQPPAQEPTCATCRHYEARGRVAVCTNGSTPGIYFPVQITAARWGCRLHESVK
jgi:hypothetical protein